MPVWLRIILIIVLIFAMICVAAGVIGYRWWTHNKDRMLTAAKHAQSDGQEFGRGKQVSACIDESLRQVRDCGGLPCEIKVRLFLDGCMQSATDTHDYCESIPRQSEFLKRAEWTMEQCVRRGWGTDQRCNRIMQGVGGVCDREASK